MFPKRTIIFVHGLGLTNKVWAPQLDWCKKNQVEYLALTLPGHGERRNENILIDKMVDEIVTTVMRFKEVILVGHSFGSFLCSLAAPRLKNVQSVLYINPLLESNQIRPLFLAAVTVTSILQRIFGIGRPGSYSNGSIFFWRFGIYPYCLIHNSAEIIAEILYQVKGKGGFPPPSPAFSTTILYSKQDELLTPIARKGIVLPISGHMLFRLSPGVVNSFLEQAMLHPYQ